MNFVAVDISLISYMGRPMPSENLELLGVGVWRDRRSQGTPPTTCGRWQS